MIDPRETYHDHVRRDIFPLLPPALGTVLDFGGGIGATARALRLEREAARAVLFDQVAHKPAAGIDAAEALDLDNLGEVEAALQRQGPFDTVLCLDILEHLKDPWATVKLIDKAIKPGGTMVISLPNVCHISFVGPLLFRGRLEYVDAGILDRTHLRWFTRHSAIALATSTGMELTNTRLHSPRRRGRMIAACSFGLLTRFVATQIKLTVRKPH